MTKQQSLSAQVLAIGVFHLVFGQLWPRNTNKPLLPKATINTA